MILRYGCYDERWCDRLLIINSDLRYHTCYSFNLARARVAACRTIRERQQFRVLFSINDQFYLIKDILVSGQHLRFILRMDIKQRPRSLFHLTRNVRTGRITYSILSLNFNTFLRPLPYTQTSLICT